MKRIALVLVGILAVIGTAFGQESYDGADTGTKVLGSYFSTDVDNVSLTDGNLHVHIPIFSLPGRELPLSLAVDYNSQFEELRNTTDEFGNPITVFEFLGWRKSGGFGHVAASRTSTTTGPIWPPYNAPNGYAYNGQTTYTITITWVDGNGSKNNFTATGYQWWCSQNYYTCSQAPAVYPPDSTFYDNLSIDSTSSDFMNLQTGNYFSSAPNNSVPLVITLKNGQRLINGNQITTPNGNFLNGSSSTEMFSPYHLGLGDLVALTDTVGRSVSYSNVNNIETFTTTDSNGASQIYRIHWATQTVFGAATGQVVQSIDLPNGRSYTFTYNTNGLLSQLTFPSGAYIAYQYAYQVGGGCQDSSGDCVSTRSVSDGQSSKTWTYTYQPNDALSGSSYTTVTDPNGGVTTHSYSGSLLEISSTDPTGTTTAKSWSSYNPSLQNVTKTYSDGTCQLTYFYYDGYNNPTNEIDFAPGTSPNCYTTALRQVVHTWTNIGNHILNLPATEIISDQSGTGFSKHTQWTYDDWGLTGRSGTIPGWSNPGTTARGNLTAVCTWDASIESCHDTIYDVLGNRVTSEDALGRYTNYAYTDNFTTSHPTISTYAFPTAVTNPLNQVTATKYDYNTGLPMITTDLRGFTTTNVYDIMNRATSITEPNGKVTTYSYNDSTLATIKEVTVDGAGNKGHVETDFDGLYRVLHTRTNDPEGTIVVDTVYDGLNHVIQKSNPYRIGGTPSAWTYASYDGAGRVSCTSVSAYTTSPCGPGGPTDAKVQYAYTAHQTTTTNEAGNQRRYIYGGLFNKLIEGDEPNPTLSTPLVTTYTYDYLGNLSQTYQSGQTRALAHNALGWETQENLPESGVTNYTYDVMGHMLTATDARNVTTTYAYDALGRATTRSYSDGTPTVTFNYDASGYIGLRTSMTDALGTVTYAYDNMDRLTTETRTFGANAGVSGTYSTAYAYNVKGDLTTMTYPSGRVVNFVYNTGGGCCNSRLSYVGDGTTGQTIATTMNYDASGSILNRTLNVNGAVPLTQTFTYNYREQQTQMRATQGTTDVMNLSYGYGTTNNVGELLSRTDAIQPEHSVNYTYDSLYRLQAIAAPSNTWGISWTFDVWGNRLTQTPTGYVQAAGVVGTQTLGYVNNRLTNQTYDAAGNVTNDGNHNYTFNGKNQITTMDGGTATYLYDGEGRRMKKTVGSVSTFYFYGPAGIISEFSTDTSISNATVASTNDKTAFQTSDRQGTAVLLVAANGLVLENNRTLPYGELWCPEPSSQTTKKFTGYERDAESNLDYAMNRYMANTNGRFMSKDMGPIRMKNPQSMNRYVYTGNDPINNLDPSGNITENNGCDASDPTCNPCDQMLDPRGAAKFFGDTDNCDTEGGGGDPGTGEAAPSSPDCKSLLAADMAGFLLQGPYANSPLTDQVWTMINYGDTYNVDPRLVLALAGAETTFGTDITRGNYNAWNDLFNRRHPSQSNFNSWDSAIQSVTHMLRNSYLNNGQTTTTLIYNGKPTGRPGRRTNAYCNGPDCVNGLNNMNSFLEQMGGDPANLAFPCPRENSGGDSRAITSNLPRRTFM